MRELEGDPRRIGAGNSPSEWVIADNTEMGRGARYADCSNRHRLVGGEGCRRGRQAPTQTDDGSDLQPRHRNPGHCNLLVGQSSVRVLGCRITVYHDWR